MYPEKQIYDIAGLPRGVGPGPGRGASSRRPPSTTRRTCSARRPQQLDDLDDGRLPVVTTSDGTEVTCGAVVVTGGIGTFTPRPLPAGEEFLGRGLEYFVPEQPSTSARTWSSSAAATAPSTGR